jgi:hypothetical protein
MAIWETGCGESEVSSTVRCSALTGPGPPSPTSTICARAAPLSRVIAAKARASVAGRRGESGCLTHPAIVEALRPAAPPATGASDSFTMRSRAKPQCGDLTEAPGEHFLYRALHAAGKQQPVNTRAHGAESYHHHAWRGHVAGGIASLAGCGNTYRPVVSAISPVGPASQPTKYAVAVSSPSPTANGLATFVDFSGDTVLSTPSILSNPSYFAASNAGNQGFAINAAGSLDEFNLNNPAALLTSDINQTTLNASYSSGHALGDHARRARRRLCLFRRLTAPRSRC